MKFLAFIVTLVSLQLTAQVNYGTPPEGLIPDKLQGLPRAITVTHFPEVNDPVEIDNTYYWKHSTAVLAKESPVKIIEYGAYLYYNDQWNLRRSYPLNELKESFGIKKQQMLQGHPYVWVENWRVGDQLFGGWALWYFLGETPDGETVCGYGRIHTTDNLLNPKN